jgi:hypothetical protein
MRKGLYTLQIDTNEGMRRYIKSLTARNGMKL